MDKTLGSNQEKQTRAFTLSSPLHCGRHLVQSRDWVWSTGALNHRVEEGFQAWSRECWREAGPEWAREPVQGEWAPWRTLTEEGLNLQLAVSRWWELDKKSLLDRQRVGLLAIGFVINISFLANHNLCCSYFLSLLLICDWGVQVICKPDCRDAIWQKIQIIDNVALKMVWFLLSKCN